MLWTSAIIPLLAAASALASPVISQDSQAVFGSEGPVTTMDKWSYTNCGDSGDIIQVKSINVFPDPPKPGQNLTVRVEADVLERIEEGAYADVEVKLGLVKILEKEFDVCEEARNNNATIQCPVEPGPYIVEQTVELPNEIPRAKFVINVNGYTADDDDMLCLQLVVDFMKNPFPRPRRIWS